MPYKDITYDNGFTERFYYDETEWEQALRMSRTNKVSKFPSANSRSSAPKRLVILEEGGSDDLSQSKT